MYMSEIGHIVSTYNKKTVQQKYAKDKNEEEIGSAPQKGERKTQREIAEIAQVTEVTIRNRYKELVERLMFQMSI